MIDRVAARLLGRHVRGRADDLTGAGQARDRLVAAVARDRDAEVDDARVVAAIAPLDEHVVGLEIAMHESHRVRVLEAAQQLPDQQRHALRAVAAS